MAIAARRNHAFVRAHPKRQTKIRHDNSTGAAHSQRSLTGHLAPSRPFALLPVAFTDRMVGMPAHAERVDDLLDGEIVSGLPSPDAEHAKRIFPGLRYSLACLLKRCVPFPTNRLQQISFLAERSRQSCHLTPTWEQNRRAIR